MSRALLLSWVLLGCASPRPAAEPRGEIVIPTEHGRDKSDAPPPPRGEPTVGDDRGDPYVYFVGDWDGVVNDKLKTQLTVSSDGRFHIHLPVHQHRPICDLWGKLRVSDRVIYFDIDQSTCEAERVGTTLERHLVNKSENEMVVRAEESKMVVRYTRKKE